MNEAPDQILFSYFNQDSAAGVTRISTKILPHYDADEGALTKTQCMQLRKSAPKAEGGTIRNSLFHK